MHEQALFDKDKRYFTLKFPLEDFAGFKTMNVIQVSKDNPWQSFFLLNQLSLLRVKLHNQAYIFPGKSVVLGPD